ncbi:BN159_2729 family protein [Streptomyces sp. NBC_01476]|uniref:BN159_2729 family protein n=1 Tax=Streptomyces sp. NBC_01476 TaxID=2903881 RepID=UPI002E37E3A9|nr:BN159_2729 family protein [Streptomyces sp. NBC_01476]
MAALRTGDAPTGPGRGVPGSSSPSPPSSPSSPFSPSPAGDAPEPVAPEPSAAGSREQRAARHWARAQARRTASSLAAAYGAHPDVVSVLTEDERVVMIMHIRELSAWYVHRSMLGIRPETVLCHQDVCIGTAMLVATPVRLVGHGVPGLLAQAAAAAQEPYRLWDRVYDLAAPLEDGHGTLWQHRGGWAPDGVPLLVPYGRREPCRLPTVLRMAGSLEAAARLLPVLPAQHPPAPAH